jgi:hypothetical protein
MIELADRYCYYCYLRQSTPVDSSVVPHKLSRKKVDSRHMSAVGRSLVGMCLKMPLRRLQPRMQVLLAVLPGRRHTETLVQGIGTYCYHGVHKLRCNSDEVSGEQTL